MEPNEIDVALRQQIYLEALKDYEADRATELTDAVMVSVITLLVKLGFDSFVNVPKSQINALLVKINETLRDTLAAHNKQFVANMQEVLAAVLGVTKSNYGFTTGKRVTAAAFSGSAGGNKRLWKQLTGDLIPGTGHMPLEMIKDLNKSIIQQTRLLIKRAFAEKWTTKQLIAALRGTPQVNFKDGLINKIINQYKTVARTMVQHIQAWLDYNVGQLFFNKYQWVSTLDSHTTEICRARHGKIYEYGKGPKPPAHYNCRSKIVGIAGSLANQIPRSFYSWLLSQPPILLADIVGNERARQLQTGSARAKDYGAFSNNKRLTPSQFGKKVNMMQSAK